MQYILTIFQIPCWHIYVTRRTKNKYWLMKNIRKYSSVGLRLPHYPWKRAQSNIILKLRNSYTVFSLEKGNTNKPLSSFWHTNGDCIIGKTCRILRKRRANMTGLPRRWKAGSLMGGSDVASLFSIKTTEDIVGRLAGAYWTHKNPTWIHLKASSGSLIHQSPPFLFLLSTTLMPK